MQTKLRFSVAVVDTAPPLVGYPAMASAQDYLRRWGPASAATTISPRTWPPAARLPSGFRASGALLIRQPGVSLSDLAWQSRAITSLAAPQRLSDPGTQGISAMPYLGIGYSDYSLKTGWGFWADIGLVVQSPGSALGMGRVLSGRRASTTWCASCACRRAAAGRQLLVLTPPPSAGALAPAPAGARFAV